MNQMTQTMKNKCESDSKTIKFVPMVKRRAEALSVRTKTLLKDWLEVSISIYKQFPSEESKQHIGIYSEYLNNQSFHKELLEASFDVARRYNVDKFELYDLVRKRYLQS